ncbi:formate--tetrahydrofolate ligase, partial [Candidatus Poribacteria bacterium]|nr:formate--tetrahydrofolate ligase [Candidatus Poribacteria bacterium]
ITPTSAGEGKTLTSIGLGQGLTHLGKRTVVALRQPSLGPVFGVKGSAVGSGKSGVEPREAISIHFTGDIHAVGAAHNLLAAMLDNHLDKGNELRIDTNRIVYPRCIDMNDRSLRTVVVGHGGGQSGVERESGFVITAASEVMAVLCLSGSIGELKQRLGDIVVAFDVDGVPVRARDLGADGAMAAVLREAIQPNLVQTTEGVPVFIHGGPFANIAHGTNSIVATRLARKLGDYAVFECGFGADLGAEKFLDIVAPQFGLAPDVVVLVASARALKRHGGAKQSSLNEESVPKVRKGLENLRKHLDMLATFEMATVVAVNRFPQDTERELQAVLDACREWGVPAALSEAYGRGGQGAAELARAVVGAAETGSPKYAPLYERSDSPRRKLERVAEVAYGADGVDISPEAEAQIDQFVRLGYGELPVCVAKTQNSVSDDPKKVGAPRGWRLSVREVRLSAGAGFLVAVCGNMLLMPGLPAVPLATEMDIDDDGTITGLQ